MRGDRPFTSMARRQQGARARNFAVIHSLLDDVDALDAASEEYLRPAAEEAVDATIRAMPQKKLDWEIRHPEDCGCRCCRYRRGEDYYVGEHTPAFYREGAEA